MAAITFAAFRSGEPITLDEILMVLGRRGRSSSWRLSAVEVAANRSAEQLHSAADRDALLQGNELATLGAATQVIDGVFQGFEPGEKRPWVILRAVDGQSWDVVCDDVDVLRAYERAFPDAAPLPDETSCE